MRTNTVFLALAGSAAFVTTLAPGAAAWAGSAPPADVAVYRVPDLNVSWLGNFFCVAPSGRPGRHHGSDRPANRPGYVGQGAIGGQRSPARNPGE
jgi:hypothetical protein